MKRKLGLDLDKIAHARDLAASIARPIQTYIDRHTTTAVERATLRLLGADGVDAEGAPVPNLIVDRLGARISGGASRAYVNALLKTGKTVEQLNAAIADGLDISTLETVEADRVHQHGEALARAAAEQIDRNVAIRNARLDAYRENAHRPMQYVIVATGNIHEDVKQAVAAAEQGADAIAVIRSSAQSLLDYVPHGETTEGFGGTYATEANFRIMRDALDAASDRCRRYIRLVNYCSGLCMPEIAVMGARQRLDMMLNDCMYGILFRDINMCRTFVDQHFSRMVNAYADVIINTGEDNYLTTSDAVQKAHTVLTSQWINERFAWNAGLPSRLQGLGHAFEIDPEIPNSFLWELAQAQMAREIFPDSPLKYMPPTKHMTGNIFLDFAKDMMFNFASKATDQDIHLLGMLTEAIHNPHLQDRCLAVWGARYVMNGMADFYDECSFKPDGIIVSRARDVLDEAIALLEDVEKTGLLAAIGEARFADIQRKEDGGRGLDGVAERTEDYWNPVEALLRKALRLADGKLPEGRPPVSEVVRLEDVLTPEPAAATEAKPSVADDLTIAPYGDTLNDGAVQLSFTLPVEDSPLAREAAAAMAAKMGLRDCEIAHATPAGAGFTFFVVCAKTDASVDPAKLDVPDDPAGECMDFDQINEFIERRIGRRLVVVGACTGSDAHTVGIDAILNMKGCKHHWGLERYPTFYVHNLGAQVPNDQCIRVAKQTGADAILISQVNTEKNRHIENMKQFIDLLTAEGMRDRVIAIAGGPRVGQKLALEVGFDAGFSRGTYAEHVATFIARTFVERRGG